MRLSPVLVVGAALSLLFLSIPAYSSEYLFVYAGQTSTIRSPSVTLVAGTAGSPRVDAIPIAATVTATAGLTFYENASAPLATPALDQSVIGQSGGTGSNFVTTPTLTTVQQNDVVYTSASISCAASACPARPAISDSQSHTWHARSSATQASNNIVFTWYTTSAPIFSATVTIQFPVGVSKVFTVIAFGISGADTASPFDPNAAVPATGSNNGASPQTASATITTTNPNDLIIGALVATQTCNTGTCLTITKGGAFTLIQQSTLGFELGGSAEYETVTAAAARLSVTYSVTSSGGTGNIYWSIVADAVMAGQPSFTTDTSLSPPGSSNSFSLPIGYSAFFWSPPYTSGGTLYAGSWLLDLWAAQATLAGSLTASIYIVNSTNGVTATVLGSAAVGHITTSKTEIKTTLSGSQASVPVNGRIILILTNPTSAGSSAVTIYWGAGQLTNFQTPNVYNYVFSITNGAAASWTINLATMGSLTSNLNRLSNLTVWLASPTNIVTKEVVVSNGILTQSSGSTVTLAGSGKYQIALAAYSNVLPTSSNTPSRLTISLNSGS